MSRIVINWGSYGSGKTHAANYFTKTSRIKELANDLGMSESLSFKVNLPRTSSDIVQAFWRSLLGQISFEDLVDDIQRLQKLLGSAEFEEVVTANANDVVVRQLILMLAEVDPTHREESGLEAYMYGDKAKGTLSRLKLPLGLSDDEQIVNLISTIFSCLTYQKKLFSAIFLWIDEFEDIDTVSKSSSERFTTFLRQLVDKTPNNLTIFLNFTPKRFLNIEDLSVYMGEALLSRARIRIHFEEPSIEEALHYLKDLLANPKYRNTSFAGDPFSPFSEEVARYVLDHLERRSIRKINEAFSIILEFALIHEEDEISKEFVDSIKEEIMSWRE